MSKMDNLRAMREARYDRAVARASQAVSARETSARATSPVALATPPRESIEPSVEPLPVAAEAEPAEQLCGHRNMSGRTCTREKGHSAKSHRYS
jgi:hypothetical protein